MIRSTYGRSFKPYKDTFIIVINSRYVVVCWWAWSPNTINQSNACITLIVDISCLVVETP